ncbi:class I tRNA ligase family protein [Blattabacterium cuenoti]|uniref:class I tRNA ligase family protein n=1 Tax=Blattabacterium cuenoti TaxID=1653831 RepID=UPI001CC2668E|nr:class I tRNA ligase family protein [Blattabacterium cuenoti]
MKYVKKMDTEYNFRKIEKYWQIYWEKHHVFLGEENNKKKYYILNMFPYPSGYGLHVGHCLGYISSDIYARYKRIKGYNVLHPIGFDSFGLPAEQYAIQTGKHPLDTIKENEKKYTNQIKKIGISFNWNRKISTSSPQYYRWTQWMFIQIFHSWYDKNYESAKPIHLLIQEFNQHGNVLVNAITSYQEKFSSTTWKKFNVQEKENILQNYRLAYLCQNIVNWCPYLGTVLANEEIKNGRSIRGGYPVYKKNMLQWHIRISAYAERLLKGLDNIKCSDSLKKIQIHWIGKKHCFSIFFKVRLHESEEKIIECLLFEPEKIFGITFIILSPYHPFSKRISTSHKDKKNVSKYLLTHFLIKNNFSKSISGVFTGNHVIHPFTKKKIPIYISNFFPLDHRTKSMIGIPGHEKRSYQFAKKFGLKSVKVVKFCIKENKNICIRSHFLNGLSLNQAKKKVVKILRESLIPKKSYKIHDAIFSRQRYWGEPIPIYFENNIPKTIPVDYLPLLLPKKNHFNHEKLLKKWAWDKKKKRVVETHLIDHQTIFPIETSTMPSWAGSSWYFLRYMDVENNNFFIDKKKEMYWKNIDLYIGGSEHSTGHLIYSRFWHKFLKDRGWVQTEEPFKKILNQGMILSYSFTILKVIGKNIFVSYNLKNRKKTFFLFQELYISHTCIKEKDKLDINQFKYHYPEFYNPIFILKNGEFFCKRQLEKMSKSKYNVINPELICEQYGADTFRMYAMFLGPIVQSKPWSLQKIIGIKNFLRKLWNLFHKNGIFQVNEENPTNEEFKILHTLIKKIEKKIQLFSFNTCISHFMIMVNQLIFLKCNKRKILEPLIQLISPFAPHISEELWMKLGKKKSIIYFPIPSLQEQYLLNDKQITYKIMINGKFKFLEKFDKKLSMKQIEKNILNHKKIKNTEKRIKKLVIIPKKIINILY